LHQQYFQYLKQQYNTCSLDIRLYGSQNIVLLPACAETTNLHKSKQITPHRGDFMSHGFLKTVRLALKESNYINVMGDLLKQLSLQIPPIPCNIASNF
jgi:hypothetical protein